MTTWKTIYTYSMRPNIKIGDRILDGRDNDLVMSISDDGMIYCDNNRYSIYEHKWATDARFTIRQVSYIRRR